MSNFKEYKYDERKPLSKNHKIVAAAHQKGLTGIKVSWYGGMNRRVQGWILESDQIKWMKLGLNIEGAIERIKMANPLTGVNIPFPPPLTNRH